MTSKIIKLYPHTTDGGAKYLLDTFVEGLSGWKEGTINDRTKYVIRIDGGIELTVINHNK